MTEAFHFYFFWKRPSSCACATRFPIQITCHIVVQVASYNLAGTFKTSQAMILEDSNIKTSMDIEVTTSKFSP